MLTAMDLFVVPAIFFRPVYGLLIMGHGRRQILWLGVTADPTAEWIANQLTQACGWEQIPRYLIRDRDGTYGQWRDIGPPDSIHRHSRSPDVSSRTLAERVRRTADRIDPQGTR
jgi:hypothetical protein